LFGRAKREIEGGKLFYFCTFNKGKRKGKEGGILNLEFSKSRKATSLLRGKKKGKEGMLPVN